jgi:phage terminase small subunit
MRGEWWRCEVSPKAERFVTEYLIDLNATKAAIRAGYSAKSAASIGEENLRKPEIAAAIKAAQSERAENNGMTVDAHLLALKEIRDAAISEGKYSAAATAEVARGKVAGFYVEQVKIEDITDRAEQMRKRREARLAARHPGR